ncbi:MAG: tRNA epoxyqueuosine(34) reductase QueG [Bacteroidetes bacterium GWA2_40_14]|nr:MAG: tRNA epoxyqueuosine(34) reductase QueG [Bacteroidetes bacterium GWA2_40_14]
MPSDKSKISQFIKEKAMEIGFDGVGISKAEKLEGFEQPFQQWLKAGYHAGMEYMERNLEKRVDPTVLVPGAKSVVSFILSYYPQELQPEQLPQIAKYAYGTDYHVMLKDKIQQVWDFIKTTEPSLDGRIFVDSAPVSDKLWAVKAGLGWLGKNSCLINKEIGSFVFIGEMVINLELAYDEPYPSNYCGSCTQCIDACPTGAIVKPGTIDSNRCISYLTIENKSDSISSEFSGKFGQRIFGCDTCQDVCPWNKKPLTTHEKRFIPDNQALWFTTNDWLTMEEPFFKETFKDSSIKRAKLSGMQRNVRFVNLNPAVFNKDPQS